MRRRVATWLGGLVAVVLVVNGCSGGNLNSPYRASEARAPIYYSTFSEPPKHLDPARAYSEDEAVFIGQIYETPFQYHFLKRPYELIPQTAESIPSPIYYDANGGVLPDNASRDQIARVAYEIRIQPGILYQEHPCFAKGADGRLLYADVDDADLDDIEGIQDFEHTGTRELTARDYVTEIYRLADPRVSCPIFSTLQNYIIGMGECQEALREALTTIREERKARAGIGYDLSKDERENPIILDYFDYPFEGVEVVDDYTYRIVLARPYPQILYWLAMSFFAPVPKEAIRFYEQGPMIRRNITLDQFPVGTGPYRIGNYNRNLEITLVRNEHYHGETYPTDGEASDQAAGLLDDAGKPLPFVDRYVFKLEKESLPRWNKFLQGYYDASGISSDSFDQAIVMEAQSGPVLSDFMTDRGIELSTDIQPSSYYLAFNMLDPVIGGYTPDRQKLRQALSIAIDMEEFIEIFSNGRGLPATGPIPPGIFGSLDGREGTNPFMYDWNDASQTARRKSIDEAKRLLAEAGYPNGRDAQGNPLKISFDNAWTGAGSRTRIRWFEKQFEKIDVIMVNNSTDYSRFQDKVRNANFQMVFWGWNADYPDPENFMFLLYGPNGTATSGGANHGNYDNPRFNELFERMENMTNSPARLELIREMTLVAQEDVPWIWGFHPVAFSLRHGWVRNSKPNMMARNTLKYRSIDVAQRAENRAEWNRPNYVPAGVVALVLVLGSLPAVLTVRKRHKA